MADELEHREGANPPPDHLIPLVPFVNKALAACGYNESIADGSSSLPADIARINGIVDEYNPTNPPGKHDYTIEQLRFDLSIIDTLAQEGMDGVNRRLQEAFEEYKTNPYEGKKSLDALLNRAIHLFPHLAAGVRLTFNSDVMPELNGPKPEDLYSYYSHLKRTNFGYLLQAWKNEHSGESMPPELRLPLPARRHFGEMDSYTSDVLRVCGSISTGNGDDRPALSARLGDASWDETYFTGGEIAGISFFGHDELATPWVNQINIKGKGWQSQLVARVSALREYAAFHRFRVAEFGREDSSSLPAMNRVNRVLVASSSSDQLRNMDLRVYYPDLKPEDRARLRLWSGNVAIVLPGADQPKSPPILISTPPAPEFVLSDSDTNTLAHEAAARMVRNWSGQVTPDLATAGSEIDKAQQRIPFQETTGQTAIIAKLLHDGPVLTSGRM